MSGTSSAREALIAEALGEMAELLDRLEAVAPALDVSRLALINASTELAGQVTAFESRMAGITENAKAQAVKHIARRTEEIARVSGEAQTRAMEEAARMLFRTEVGPALQRVGVSGGYYLFNAVPYVLTLAILVWACSPRRALQGAPAALGVSQ